MNTRKVDNLISRYHERMEKELKKDNPMIRTVLRNFFMKLESYHLMKL